MVRFNLIGPCRSPRDRPWLGDPVEIEQPLQHHHVGRVADGASCASVRSSRCTISAVRRWRRAAGAGSASRESTARRTRRSGRIRIRAAKFRSRPDRLRKVCWTACSAAGMTIWSTSRRVSSSEPGPCHSTMPPPQLDRRDPVLAAAGALDFEREPAVQDALDRLPDDLRLLAGQVRGAGVLHRHQHHLLERQPQLVADHLELHRHVGPVGALEAILQHAMLAVERQRIEGDAAQPREPVHVAGSSGRLRPWNECARDQRLAPVDADLGRIEPLEHEIDEVERRRRLEAGELVRGRCSGDGFRARPGRPRRSSRRRSRPDRARAPASRRDGTGCRRSASRRRRDRP